MKKRITYGGFFTKERKVELLTFSILELNVQVILTQCWLCLAFNIGLLVPFLVTLDYKGLVLLMAKIEDEDFLLGGRGLCVEFCIFCLALRVSLDYVAYKHIVTDFSLVQFVCSAIYTYLRNNLFLPPCMIHQRRKKGPD